MNRRAVSMEILTWRSVAADPSPGGEVADVGCRDDQ
jgi:hypothetical protein